jgi:hypothetical protein
METEVIVKRPLLGMEIRQKSKSGYFNANDLLNVGNRWRIEQGLQIFNYQTWALSSSTTEFLTQLEKHIGEKPIISKRGKTGERWMHPYAFIDLALRLSPTLKIEVYAWLSDELLKYRNNSGDSYKKMCGALWLNATNKGDFAKDMVKVAVFIRDNIGVKNWQLATKEQLEKRDKIHEAIALLCDVLKDNKQAIKIGVLKYS